ncbi:MAG: response regulator transcription factor [Anaerolineae bacterium]
MEPIKVLVADGDDASREGICLMLDDNLHTVIAARDSDQALRLVAASCPRVALVDVHLPAAGGLEVARHIKARWPEVKVVILTVFDEYLDEALAAGADGYLLKGRPLAELRATIRRVAGTAHKHSNNVLDS